MKRILKHFAIAILGVGGIFPTGLTCRSELQSLMHKLSPISSGHRLIRLGPKGDGGYLVPDNLTGIEACFSPGVSFVSGFEKDCADLGMKVFLADKSVDQPNEEHEKFYFTKKYVGITTSDEFLTLDYWVSYSLPGIRADLLLQMDIEGFEYETFLGMSDSLMIRFRIIIAEFHFLDQLWSTSFFRLASRAFEKILQTHKCVHIHPNNRYRPIKKMGVGYSTNN